MKQGKYVFAQIFQFVSHNDFNKCVGGDDAIGLAKDDGIGNFVLIDVIGEPTNDPVRDGILQV